RLDDPSALITEVSPALAVSAAPDGLAQLLRDVDNSMRNDVLARRHREGWSAELRLKIAAAGVPGFIAYLERSLPPHLAAMTLD
ncbi:MAG: IucA/IucC family siderophore biosynthesis protein, partial [Mesorhizobium sp.]